MKKIVEIELKMAISQKIPTFFDFFGNSLSTFWL